MPWPTWDEAAVAAALSALLWLLLGRFRPQQLLAVRSAAYEFALISALYSVWRLARMLPIGDNEGAIARAHRLVAFERWLHLPSELSLQHFVIDHPVLGHFATFYYATVHVPALIAFLVWLFIRHRDDFPHWRNGLALVTAGCLAIRFVRVAPPRYLPDLGYVDLSKGYGMSVYGDIRTSISDQFTAMPSIHVGWAAVVSFGIFATTASLWRWFFLLHVFVTALVVSATGHHWWLDGIVAVLLLTAALAGDRRFRRGRSERTDRPDPAVAAGTASDTGSPVRPG